MGNVIVMSCSEAKRYSYIPNIPTCVIISIDTDGVHNVFNRNNNIKDVMFCTFDDIEYGNMAITEKQAHEISEFVKRWINVVDNVIVHCDAGISRSAGIGAAIMKWSTGDDTAIFNNRRFTPNMRCYRFIINSLMEDGV